MPLIYYFHGLNGFLTAEKRKVLEPLGHVIAPVYDFQNQQTLATIKESFYDKALNDAVFIGTSFGGYVANYLSTVYDRPSLVFNPALVLRTIPIGLDAPLTSHLQSLSMFVLGEKDELLSAADNIRFIENHIKGPKEILMEKDMAHHIPPEVFKKHVRSFFEKIHAGNNGLAGV